MRVHGKTKENTFIYILPCLLCTVANTSLNKLAHKNKDMAAGIDSPINSSSEKTSPIPFRHQPPRVVQHHFLHA